MSYWLSSLICCFLMLFASCYAAENEQQYTLAIIKPNAVANNHIGAILDRLESKGLKIKALEMIQLTPAQAQEFYKEHHERPFYPDLVKFMTSGPVVVLVLEGKDAVTKNREIMGATDPKKAAAGTIRADFAKSLTENAIHGSDSPESARREILFFFPAFPFQ